MERKNLMQIFVVFVAILFLIGMFTYFERENIKTKTTSNGNLINETENYIAAEGTTQGILFLYGNVIYISPWNESYKPQLEALKAEKQIDYINVVENIAVVTIASKSNLTYIREKLGDTESDIYGEVTITFSDPVNFFLMNGSNKNMSIGSTSAKIDPSTPVGEKIDVSVTADISKTDIKNIRMTLKPKITTTTQEIELKCTDSYYMQGNVDWENRNINLSNYATVLNVSSDSINYQKDDSIILSRKLNTTEMADLKSKNISALTSILEDAVYASTTNKTEIESAMSYLGTNFTYSQSKINSTLNASESQIPALLGELNSTITNILLKRNCETNISRIEINGSMYYVDRSAKSADGYFDTNKVGNGMNNLSIEVYSIGRSVTRLVLLDIQ